MGVKKVSGKMAAAINLLSNGGFGIGKAPVYAALLATFLIPTRSWQVQSKQFCLDDLALGILIASVIHRLWAIRFFVASMLPALLGYFHRSG